MIKLLETVASKQVATHGEAFGMGGGGGGGGAGCSGMKGRDLSTLVTSNQSRRKEASMKEPWVTGWVTTIGEVKYLLPDLQVQARSDQRVVETAVHVQREFVGVGGLLTTKTLHPRFEAGVTVLDVKNRRRQSYVAGLLQSREVVGTGNGG
jgi:hypothetical protein